MRKSLVGSIVLAVLIAVTGCTHYMLAERDAWRHEAEESCVNSGVPQEAPGRVRISTISGPGACGIDYPLKVSELGVSGPLGYDDEPMQPPGSIPNAGPRRWPGVQSEPLPPPQRSQTASPYGPPEGGPPPYDSQPYRPSQYGPPPYSAAQPQQPQNAASQIPPAPYGAPRHAPQQYSRVPYGTPQTPSPQAGTPMSLSPPGVAEAEDDADEDDVGGEAHPYYDQRTPPPVDIPPSLYSPRPMMAPPGPREAAPVVPPSPPSVPPLGPPVASPVSPGLVAVKPAATLACPIVSVLDKWISGAVQPAALKWFHVPVVEIKQISAYSCRGMNGNPNAHISEHAFGNALDIAEFDLADGHKISVQYGWHGSPEEQGFLHDVQAAACQDFTTVLAPGANVYHYNHIHVDLMRRRGRPYICEPRAIPGDVVAERARAHYAHNGFPRFTGSIKKPLGYAGENKDRLPLAVPGED